MSGTEPPGWRLHERGLGSAAGDHQPAGSQPTGGPAGLRGTRGRTLLEFLQARDTGHGSSFKRDGWTCNLTAISTRRQRCRVGWGEELITELRQDL